MNPKLDGSMKNKETRRTNFNNFEKQIDYRSTSKTIDSEKAAFRREDVILAIGEMLQSSRKKRRSLRDEQEVKAHAA
jgi:hypothetical protein